MEMSKFFDGGSKPFSPSRVSFESIRPYAIYRRYTGGIRAVYGWYTGGIRVVYGWYTGGIRVVYGWYTLVIATSFECLTPGYIGIKKVAHLNPPWT